MASFVESDDDVLEVGEDDFQSDEEFLGNDTENLEDDTVYDDDLEHRIWLIFTYYAVRGNPLEPWYVKASQWMNFCKSCQMLVGTGLRDADANVVFQHYTDSSLRKLEGRNLEDRMTRQKKMTFSDFLDGMAEMARKIFPDCDEAGDEAMERLLNERVFVHAKTRAPKSVDEVLEDDGVHSMFAKYNDALREVFQFYAKQPTEAERAANRHQQRASVNAMMQSLHYNEFLQFASDFNLTASVLLTTYQLAEVFLSSNEGAWALEMTGGLTFEEFWEALVRCALVAYEKKDVSNSRKLSALFLYMTSNLEEAVPRAVNAAGRSSASTNAQTLMKGAKRFQWLVTQQWREDESCDYLEKTVRKARGGRAILGRIGKGAKRIGSSSASSVSSTPSMCRHTTQSRRGTVRHTGGGAKAKLHEHTETRVASKQQSTRSSHWGGVRGAVRATSAAGKLRSEKIDRGHARVVSSSSSRTEHSDDQSKSDLVDAENSAQEGRGLNIARRSEPKTNAADSRNGKKKKKGRWKTALDSSTGNTYYYHTKTKEVRWNPPDGHC